MRQLRAKVIVEPFSGRVFVDLHELRRELEQLDRGATRADLLVLLQQLAQRAG